KDNVSNLLRGRFRALRGQVGYKLPALLESRGRVPTDAEEVLFGDDAEADAFIYSLYADMVAGRVDERILLRVLDAAEVYADERARILAAWKTLPTADPVRRIFIHLDRLTPPAYFTRYGPRVVPIFNYFQASLVLMADGMLTAPQVLRVAGEMVQAGVHNLFTLSNSLQDLMRRGLPLEQVAESLVEAMQGPHQLANALRPVPDIVAAFSRRLASLGTNPPPPRATAVDYVALIDDARPRTHKSRRPPG
ncbi:MAG: hypothetical protein L0Y66_01775, partial [Myxococcaceae bacterium]|nr:hypothetical protein [Myxococcaceae bacterium]